MYKIWGSKGSKLGQFDLVHNIAVDSKYRVYIADRDNERVQVFNSEGTWLRQWGKFGENYGLFITGEDILFVTSGKGNEVFIVDVEGNILSKFGQSGTEPGQFQTVHSVHVDKDGSVYLTEVDGRRIQKFVPVAD